MKTKNGQMKYLQVSRNEANVTFDNSSRSGKDVYIDQSQSSMHRTPRKYHEQSTAVERPHKKRKYLSFDNKASYNPNLNSTIEHVEVYTNQMRLPEYKQKLFPSIIKYKGGDFVE